MGNWRTVNISGQITKSDIESIVEFLKSDYCWDTDAACFHIGNSVCGLNNWIKEDGTINVSGNLAERDFENDDIENALKYLAMMYPSLSLTLHSGSDYEGLGCTATFHVSNGKVERCKPEIEELKPIKVNFDWMFN